MDETRLPAPRNAPESGNGYRNGVLGHRKRAERQRPALSTPAQSSEIRHIHIQPFQGAVVEQVGLGIVGDGKGMDELAGDVFAQGEGIIGAEANAARTHEVDDVFEHARIVHQAIEPELAHVFARIVRVVDGHQVGPGLPAVFDAADAAGEGAAAMGEGHAQAGQTFEHAAEDHGADGQAGFGRHAHEPGQPVFRHFRFGHPPPGMHEQAHVEVLHRLKNGEQLGLVQVPVVHVAADLDAAEAERLAAFQFLDGQVGMLHRQGAEANIALRMALHHTCEVIVQVAADFQRIAGFGPIAEHHRDGAQHLHIDREGIMVAFLDAHLAVPAIVVDFAEELIVYHHPGAAGFVVFEPDEFAVAEFLAPAGQVFGDDVGMDIDRKDPVLGHDGFCLRFSFSSRSLILRSSHSRLKKMRAPNTPHQWLSRPTPQPRAV